MNLSGKTITIILVILVLTVLIGVGFVLFYKDEVQIHDKGTEETADKAFQEETNRFIEQLQQALFPRFEYQKGCDIC